MPNTLSINPMVPAATILKIDRSSIATMPWWIAAKIVVSGISPMDHPIRPQEKFPSVSRTRTFPPRIAPTITIP